MLFRASVIAFVALFFSTMGEDRFTNSWPISVPEAAGFDSEPLVEMFDHIANRRIPVHSIQIVRSGRLVLDAYFYPYSDQMLHDVASVTKSITSTLVGLAIDKRF